MVFSSRGFGRLLIRKAWDEFFKSNLSSQDINYTSAKVNNKNKIKSKTNDFHYGDFVSIQKEETIVEL